MLNKYIKGLFKKKKRYSRNEFLIPLEFNKIELGVGGNKIFQDTIGVDINPKSDADVICDIFEFLDKQKSDSISFIYSSHLIEHLESIEIFLRKCERVLVNNGLIVIIAPHFSNPYFYSDPTHKNFFGLYTMAYLCKSSFIRKVPKYLNMDFDLSLEKTKLNFRVPINLFFLYPIFLLFKYVFNSSSFMKELYEYIFVKLIPCYEVIYFIRKD
tara:strand:+ start:3892 stop:4530 length:639 start_codon:yes stop_codon:yes gene_type:complete